MVNLVASFLTQSELGQQLNYFTRHQVSWWWSGLDEFMSKSHYPNPLIGSQVVNSEVLAQNRCRHWRNKSIQQPACKLAKIEDSCQLHKFDLVQPCTTDSSSIRKNTYVRKPQKNFGSTCTIETHVIQLDVNLPFSAVSRCVLTCLYSAVHILWQVALHFPKKSSAICIELIQNNGSLKH